MCSFKKYFKLIFENVMFKSYLGNPAIASKLLIIVALRNNNPDCS